MAQSSGANLIVATGHNNQAIGNSVRQVSEHFVKGTHLEESSVGGGSRLRPVLELLDPRFWNTGG